MGKKAIVCLLYSFLIWSCNTSSNKSDIEKWKFEIMGVEQSFNDLAQKEGLIIAFETYAAQDGIIKRGGKTIKGRAAITEWYRKDSRPNETLTWKPVFVDVSASGDLAYTYGGAVFTSIDSTGKRTERVGEFHTIWKRQADGNWKFVWD